MAIAALQRNMPIVKFLVSKGANDFDKTLLSAAYGGSIALVKYCLAQGANNLEGALANAIARSHTKLVEFLIPELKEKGVIRRSYQFPQPPVASCCRH